MGPEPIATLVRSSDTQALSDSLASMGTRDIEAELVRLDDDAMGVVFRLLDRDLAAQVFEILELFKKP